MRKKWYNNYNNNPLLGKETDMEYTFEEAKTKIAELSEKINYHREKYTLRMRLKFPMPSLMH